MNPAKDISTLRKMLEEGKTTKEIGKYFGVSRMRIYQVMTKFGLETVIRKKKNFLRDRPPKYYWLNKMLSIKKFKKEERLEILNNIDLPDVCPVLGIPLNYEGADISGYSREDNSPSIDQIVPAQGYTKNNICIISWRANRLKNNGTPEEHLKIYTYFKELQK